MSNLKEKGENKMNRLKNLNKKQIIIISVAAVIAAVLIIAGIMALSGKGEKEINVKEVSAEVSEQIADADLTEAVWFRKW